MISYRMVSFGENVGYDLVVKQSTDDIDTTNALRAMGYLVFPGKIPIIKSFAAEVFAQAAGLRRPVGNPSKEWSLLIAQSRGIRR